MSETSERAAAKAARHAKKAADAAAQARTAEDEELPEADGIATDARSILEGLPGDVEVKLYRKGNAGLEFCQAFPEPKDFSEEYVAKKWGPGVYRLLVRVPDPKTGKLQWLKGMPRSFRVAEPTISGPVAAPNGAGDKHQLDTVTLMHQMMLQSQESHRAMLAMMMQRPPDTGMELMKVLLPIMLAQKTDPMAMATQLAALLKPAGPVASMTDQLDALGKMMELASKLGDKGDDGPAWLTALKTAAPLLQQAFAMPRPGAPQLPAPAANPRTPAPRELAPVQTPSGAAPNAPTPAPVVEAASDEPPAHPLLTLLDGAMPALIRAASRDGEVELYADWLLDQVDDEHLEAFDGFLQEPSVLDQLALRYPIAEHRPWFERLLVELRTRIDAEGEADGAGEPAAPSEPDADGHVGDQ